MTGTRTPGREAETWYRGRMRPRSEVERMQREEAAAMAGPAVVDGPPPRGPAPTPADQDEPGNGGEAAPCRWKRRAGNTTPPPARKRQTGNSATTTRPDRERRPGRQCDRDVAPPRSRHP